MPLFQDEIVVRDGKPYFIPVYWGYDSVLYNTEAIAEDMAQSWEHPVRRQVCREGGAARDDAHQMITVGALFLGHDDPNAMTDAETQGRGRLPDLEEEELPHAVEQVRRGR